MRRGHLVLSCILLGFVIVASCSPRRATSPDVRSHGLGTPTSAGAGVRARPSPGPRTSRGPSFTPSTVSPSSCATPVGTSRRRAAGPGPNGSHTNTGTPAVALTFDDWPDPVNTPRILDVLAQCGVRATFCLEGAKAQMYPDVVRRIYSEGHALCNHTWRHIRQLGTYGKPRIRQDLSDTNNAIHAIVPDAVISYFRAPGGAWTDDYVTVAQELGMTPIHWDVDPSDWDSDRYGSGQAMTNHIVDTVQSQIRPGSIVLSHDFQKPDTTAAYRALLPWLIARFTLIALPPGGLPRPGRLPLPSL